MPETDLYLPVKALLEQQGYTVKAEIGSADVVGRRGEDLVIVELKLSFSLVLLHQAVARLAISDAVYVAVERRAGTRSKAMRANVSLCRRLGLGVILVRISDGHTEVVCDPGPYAPRASKKRRAVLLREFDRREGDPNTGGATGPRVTAYRQDALRCARFLVDHGPTRAANVARETGVQKARQLMYDNHYGWFERQGSGIYAVTENGRIALG